LDRTLLSYSCSRSLGGNAIYTLIVQEGHIDLSRAQPHSLSGSRIEERFHQQLDSVIYIQLPHRDLEDPDTFQAVMLRSLMKDIELDPVISYVRDMHIRTLLIFLRGFLAAAIIAAPYYNHDDVQVVKESTLDKEISARMVARFINMNYSAWLGDLRLENQKIPLYDELPPSLSTAGVIRTMFGQARIKLEGAKIYPVLREKTIGRDAHRINDSLCQEFMQKGDTGSPSEIKTMLDVEKCYHMIGDHPQGYTELRSVWRYNDLKPRCYYAMGPTHYQASKYIQPIFNSLVDLFPVSQSECASRCQIPSFKEVNK